MDVPSGIRAAAFLVILLAVLDPALGRSVSQEEEEDNRHHRHRHLNQPGSRLQEPVKYDVGTPETAVKTAGPQEEDPPAPHLPPPPAKWEVISQAAQNIGRAVSRFAPARPASYVNHHVRDVPHDKDDEDDDDDDNDDDDSPYLKETHDQVNLEDRGDDVDAPSRHHAPDVYSDEEILKITGTPSPALITSEEEEQVGEQLITKTHVPEQLMQDDSAAAEQLLRTEGAQPKKEFKPVRMPTHFESYDLEPKDGFVTLQELVNITGARVNVHKAFNASDKNGDGLLDRREFYSAPWKLGPDWRYIPIDPEEDNKSSEEDEDEDGYDEDDYDDDDLDDDDDEDEWDEWDKWDEDSELWDDMSDVDIF